MELSIFKKFNFEEPPVGMRFDLYKPSGLAKLDKILSFCEMFKEAKDGAAFYAAKPDFNCLGHMSLGMFDDDPFHPLTVSGQVGPALRLYKNDMANRRLYNDLPKLAKDTCHYVSFAPLDKLSFEPHVLTITAEPNQANILLRALTFTTGGTWNPIMSPALGCAWLFVYPFVTGKINYSVVGFGSGMPIRHISKEGKIFLSVPGDLLPMFVNNLEEMEWMPPMFTEGKQMGKLGPPMLKRYQEETAERQSKGGNR
ncbi:MAG: DUF169 domain-containing protein [Dehalococcoidales bacterium]|nr:DUF169 domain-containing protein [Dehalococcoidales bacterium]